MNDPRDNKPRPIDYETLAFIDEIMAFAEAHANHEAEIDERICKNLTKTPAPEIS